MKRLLMMVILTAGMMGSVSGYAADLASARAQGIVGEKLDGYVGVVNGAAGGQAVADEVNAKRRVEYAKISKQNNQPVAVVGKVAAETIINQLPAGSYYQAPDGSWKKK